MQPFPKTLGDDDSMYVGREQHADTLKMQAQEAVRQGTKMLPGLNAYARAITRNPKASVVWSKSGSATDGNKIMLHLPIELGHKLPHNKSLCDQRDPHTEMPLCAACAVREEVLIVLYHEMAHQVSNSFATLTEQDKNNLVRDAVRAAGTPIPGSRLAKLTERLDRAGNYVEAAIYVSPYLKTIVNSLEDFRVNSEMIAARPGTRKMFQARMYKVFTEGVKMPDGTVKMWRDAPDNSQAIVGLLAKLSGVDYHAALKPNVAAALDDADLEWLLQQARSTRNIASVYKLSLPMLEQLRKLGFCRDENDPEDEPPVGDDTENRDDTNGEQDNEPRDDQQPGDQSDAEDESDDADDGDGAQGDDESGEQGGESCDDGSPGDGEQPQDGDGDQDGDQQPAQDGEQQDGDQDGDQQPAQDGDGDQDGEQPQDGDGDQQPAQDGDGEQQDGDGDQDGDDHEARGWDKNDDDTDVENDPTYEADPVDHSGETDEPLAAGTPEEADEALKQFGGHDEDDQEVDADVEAAIDQALSQAAWFDGPAQNVHGVFMHRWEKPTEQDNGIDRQRFAGWSGRGTNAYDKMPDKLDESYIGRAVLHARRVFSDNKRGEHLRDLKTGATVNIKAVRRLIANNDPRVFQRRTQPGRKDYFVTIAVDVSGSTDGYELRSLKYAVHAQAEMMHRIGVPFAIYAHSGIAHNASQPEQWSYDDVSVDIMVVKDPNEPWDSTRKRALWSLCSFGANLDGHALEVFRKITEARPETDKILLYYTDGAMPAANEAEEAVVLRDNIKKCKRDGIMLIGVGLGTDSPSRHGLETVVVNGPEDTPKVIKALEAKFTGGTIKN